MSYTVFGFLQNATTNEYVGVYSKTEKNSFIDSPFCYSFKDKDDWYFVYLFLEKFSIRTNLYTTLYYDSDRCDECSDFIKNTGGDVDVIIDVSSAQDLLSIIEIVDSTMIEDAVIGDDHLLSLSADCDVIITSFLSALVSYVKLAKLWNEPNVKMLMIVK